MRRRSKPDAGTLLYQSRFLRAVADADLTGHTGELLFFISGQPAGRVEYSVAAGECKLTKGEMERAVRLLLKRKLVARLKDADDRRRKLLQVTENGEGVVGEIHECASPEK